MNDVTPERWLPVVGYEGFYEVSDFGRVRSLDRFERITGPRPGIRRRSGRVLRAFPMKSTGYLCVHLSRDDQQKIRTVHSLVLEAFVGLCPKGMECLHGEGGQQDNSLRNLHWGTRSENTLDQVRAGTHRNSRKEKCPEGHDYDYIAPGTSHRQCRRCIRANGAAARERRKAHGEAA